MPDKDGKALPPLPEEALDGYRERTELQFTRCQHEPEIVSSTHVRCKKCGCGWTGPEAYKLVQT